jgi:hypothetical protein
LQVVPLQQACPEAPHLQVPEAQERLTLQLEPEQHGWLEPPQAAQLPLEHEKPELQVVPLQQACPEAPHVHVPVTQVRLALQVVPPQQD